MKSAPPNKVTIDGIKAKITGESFIRTASGKTMICELTLRNGFTVRGESSCVDLANFKEDLGQQYSREAAVEKIWELEGYLLQEDIYRSMAEAVKPVSIT
ncbi:Gp49 family protein [Herminiimonas arsenitoxidans]|uniref:Gp49 family protein n=1 Tax=Herminiimonas arsenitoxidans TaxID=1809410 RepID=UPI00097133FB|nr:Gp49 family protein [Herminiimonas arsenitoxidans]